MHVQFVQYRGYISYLKMSLLFLVIEDVRTMSHISFVCVQEDSLMAIGSRGLGSTCRCVMTKVAAKNILEVCSLNDRKFAAFH